MSESMKVHWILKYFSEIAQTHGGNLLNVPESAKTQRVQITQFLTHPRHDHPDQAIWARVSDKEFSVHVKFTNKAVSHYNLSRNVLTDPTFRLTKRNHALATLGQFKPFFAHVPLSNGQGIDSVKRLALEVNLVSVIGSDSEGVFGNPRDLETNEDMKAWCESLREGGGGGNVLKVEKEVEKHTFQRRRSRIPAGRDLLNDIVSPRHPSGEQPSQSPSESDNAVMEQTTTKQEQQHANSKSKPGKESDILKEWERSWRVTEFIWPYIMDIPEEVKLEHMQILQFGRNNEGSREEPLRDISLLEDSIDELERQEQARYQEAENSAERRGLPIRGQQAKPYSYDK